MWPFASRKKTSTIHAAVTEQNGETVVDVSGQTCPGYLLSINRAVDVLASGTPVRIVTTYLPCGDDVKAWCREKGHGFRAISEQDGCFHIQIIRA